MSDKPTATHPIKGNDGKPIKPGTPLDPAQIGEKRLARLIEKGRATATAAPVNRAEQATGRPDLKATGKDGA